MERFVQEFKTTDRNLTPNTVEDLSVKDISLCFSDHLYWVRKEMPNLCVIPSRLPQQGMSTSTYHLI